MVALPFCWLEITASKRESSKYPKALVTIGDHVRKRRLDLGITQRQAAKRIGVDKTSVVNWENNRTGPTVRNTPGVMRFLNYSPIPKCDNMAQRLVNHRKMVGLTQEQFAQQLEIDPSTLSKWERGERQPRGAHLARVKREIDFGE